MTNYAVFAQKALNDEVLSRQECRALLNAPDDDLLEVLQAAYLVRSRYFGKTVRLQMLQNAKSGACQEDCHYCSQSAVSTAAIERYNLLPRARMVAGARQAAASKAQRYCIVISGRSPLDREIDEIVIVLSHPHNAARAYFEAGCPRVSYRGETILEGVRGADRAVKGLTRV